MWRSLISLLRRREMLILLFVINFLGTIYGYYWYKGQLMMTEWYLWPFVPDSPTASLFFTLVLLLYILGRRFPLLEAFAAVTLVKYGIWATVMIIWAGSLGAPMYWEHYMLIASHLGMAIQAVLYSSYYRFKLKHLMIVGIWTLTNDIMDYTLGIFPSLQRQLLVHLPVIYGFTVALSFACLLLFYFLVIQRVSKKKPLYFES